MNIKFAFLRALSLWPFSLAACNANQGTEHYVCSGNIETSRLELLKPAVQYPLVVDWDKRIPKVYFAGREIEVEVSTGRTWHGPWLTNITADGTYLSFLPNEGGTLKFSFEPDKWYSGNCILSS